MTDPLKIEKLNSDRFRLLIEAVQDYGIFMLDPQGYIQSWNAGAQRIKGYRADEVIGRHFSLLYPAEAREAHWPEEELRRAANHGKFEEEGWRVRKDGTRFWANVVITALRGPNGELMGFAKVTRDLSERREHEEALRQSEERFRLLVESVTDYAIYLLDPSGRIQSWNSGAQIIKGYRAEEVIGRHYGLFFRSQDVDAGLPQAELEEARTRGRTEQEGWRVRKDGSTFWANIVMTPIRGPDGLLLGFAKVTRDMTERRRLQDLEHSSRRINEFLAMLAHELRNPLAPIRNAVSILQMEPALNLTLRSSRDMIDRQLTHLTRLVDDLLDAGRLSSGKIRIRPERVSFNRVAARAVEACRPHMDARSHTFELDLPQVELWVSADETRLAQIIQNLLGNASKFTPVGGSIKLSARVANGRLRVDVADTGIGLPEGATDSIFELFSQGDGETAARESGLGIGLALARSLVEMHGGTLSASSLGIGHGSVFSFDLPGASATSASPDNADAERDARVAPRILVVDDNHDAADSLSEILRLLGFQVRAVYDGATALSVAALDRPVAVFLDIAMPDMNGAQVLARLRQQPGGEALFATAVSGYRTEDEKAGHANFSGFDAKLQKPVDLADLREVLARAGLEGQPHSPMKDASG